MEHEDLQYEIQPLPVIVARGTKPWCGKLVQAARHVGRRAIVTLLMGGAVVAAVAQWGTHPAEPKPFATYFVEHLFTELAVALLISAIVIFAFEWGSEVKHSLDLAGNLANAMSNHITTILNGSATDQIANAMRQLTGENADRFSDQLRSLATSINTLGGGGGWAGRSYLEFMAWYYNEATGYAESLAHLSEKLAADPKSKAEFRLVLPEATVPIDVMLARITDEMGSCGTYYAISDVFTWTKLSEFQAAQEKALKNGLQIRRIFVIGKPSDVNVPAKEVSLWMNRHYEDAKESEKRYRIKLLSQADFERLAASILQKTEHFGIFDPSDDEKHPIIVQVLDRQLQTFRIAGATEANAVLDAFHELWELPDLHEREPQETPIKDQTPLEDPAEQNSPLAKPSGKELIRDHVMSYRTRQLPRSPIEGVWYHGASDITLWTRGALREFEQAIIEAAEDGIEIKRLFVFDKKISFDKENLMFRTLKKHAEISRRKPNYQWRVILKQSMPPDLQDEPFALFRNGEDFDVEVARGSANFHIGVPKADAMQIEEGFEEIWNTFKDTPKTRTDEATVLRHFDAEWRRSLSAEDPLKKYLEDLETALHSELKKSITLLFGNDAAKVNQFIFNEGLSSVERATGNHQP